MKPTKNTYYHPFLIPLLLLAFWLGARGLNADMIWWDEHWSLRMAGLAQYGPLDPLGVMLRVASDDPGSAPIYHVALWAWSAVTGLTPFALRALSLMFGVLTVAWGYRLGADVAGRRAGLAAAVGLAGSAFYLHYFHEMRMYTLFTLLATMAVWAYWRVITTQPRPGVAVQAIFVLSLAGVFYTHYYAALVAIPIGLYHLLVVPKTRQWWRGALLLVASGVLLLPWLGVTLFALSFAGRSDYFVLSLESLDLIAMIGYGFNNGLVGFALLLIPAALAARHRRGVRALWLMTAALFAMVVGINAFLPVVKHIRHAMMLLPLYLVLVGVGAAYLSERGRSGRLVVPLLGAVWLGAGVVNSITPTFNDTLFRQEHLDFFRPHLPLDDMAARVAADAGAGDAVAYDAPLHSWAVSGPFDFYMHPLPVDYAMTDWLPGDDLPEYTEQVRGFLADDLRLWFGVEATMPPDFRQAAFEAVIADEFVHCARPLDAPALRLDLYARDPVCCAEPDTEPVIDYGTIALLHADVTPDATGATVLLAWALADDAPRGVFSVARHVLDADGDLVAQADTGLPIEPYRCEQTHIALPPGNYSLHIIVYNWQTGERLTGQGRREAVSAESIAVAEFVVD